MKLGKRLGDLVNGSLEQCCKERKSRAEGRKSLNHLHGLNHRWIILAHPGAVDARRDNPFLQDVFCRQRGPASRLQRLLNLE